MSEIYPVSRERHSHRAWNKASGFGWAAQEWVVAVGLQEAMELMMTLPLAFVRQGDQYSLVVIVGLRRGENLMVGADGKWLGSRVPTALQHYPFRALRDTEGRSILGVDERGLAPPDASGGAALFDSDGVPAADLATILGQLVQGNEGRLKTQQITTILQQQGLLQPWDLKIQGETDVQKIDGFYQINEKKFNELPGEALQTLQKSSALLMVYCQLLSMQHIHQLVRLAATRERQAQQAAAKGLPGNLIDDHGVISFANL